MFTLLLLTLVIAWLVWDWLQENLAKRREAERLAHRTELRRQALARAPNSPAAYEMLGDSLRAEGDLTEAIAAYEEAIRIGASEGGSAGAGWLAGAGIENKLRLTRLEQAQEQAPEDYGRTLRTRQQVCRICAALAMPQDRDCPNCGAPLPVDSFFDTWRHAVIRKSLIGEAIQTGVMLVVVMIALLIASWMPIEVRGALAIAALIVIPMRLLKKLGDG